MKTLIKKISTSIDNTLTMIELSMLKLNEKVL